MSTATAVAAERSVLSVSRIKLYSACPRRYRFQYVDHVEPEHLAAALPFGSAIHQAAAVFYRTCAAGTTTCLEELEQVFLDGFRSRLGERPILYSKNDDQSSLEALGQRLLETFLASASPRNILAVEAGFEVELDEDLVLRGIIDLVEEDEDGTPIVVELKTAARRWSDLEVANDIQGPLYVRALQELGLDGGLVRFDLLLKTKVPALEKLFRPVTQHQLDWTVGLAREVGSAIRAGAFPPCPSWMCGTCPFKSICGKDGTP